MAFTCCVSFRKVDGMAEGSWVRFGLRLAVAIVVIAMPMRFYATMPAAPFPIHDGMTRDEVLELVGRPRYEHGNTWLYRGNYWYSDPREVTFGADEKVESVY